MKRRSSLSRRLSPIIRWFRRYINMSVSVMLIFAISGTVLLILSSAAPENPDSITNPMIDSRSCLGGLNIALVADTSGSIKSGDFSQMQSAFKVFVSSLLPSTKVAFSLTDFSSDASVVQGFTSNATTMLSAVDNLPDERGSTNWEDGLTVGFGTFLNAPAGRQNLLVIATDGDPTDPRGSALQDAITEANTIKTAGVHILAIGIGGSPQISNLETITGPYLNTGGVNTDVITTDFANLSSALQTLANASCGVGSGGIGSGTDGSGTGTGGTGTGSGTGGTGTGTHGTGVGTAGNGTADAGRGSGISAGPLTKPNPTPVPATTGSTDAAPKPTDTPNQQPAQAPLAVPSTQPSPTPAPTPKAQGTQITPPTPQPSPFYDGKEYAPGSVPDNFAVTPVRHVPYGWISAGGTLILLAVGGFFWWHRRHTTAPATKPHA